MLGQKVYSCKLVLVRASFFAFFLLSVSWSLASDSLNVLISRIRNAADDTTKVTLLQKLAIKYSSAQYDSSLAVSERALRLSQKLNYQKGIASGYFTIGFAYYNKSKYDLALDNYLNALKIFENVDDRKGVVDCYNNIGSVYYYQLNYPKAIEYYLNSVKVSKEINDLSNQSNSLSNIGAIYYGMEKFTVAIDYFKQSLVLEEKRGNKNGVAVSYANIGLVYTDLGDYDNALIYQEKSLLIHEDMQNKDGIAVALANIALVYQKLGKNDKALENLQKSIIISKELGKLEYIKDAYSAIVEIYQKKKDPVKALEYSLLLIKVKDTIYSIESNHNIAEMQTKYETDKKEKQNQIYKQTIDLQALNANRQQIILYAVSALAILLISLAFFIYRGYRQKKAANQELSEKNLIIEEKNKIVEEKNKDITDSIRYAKRLQEAILKPAKELPTVFPESFIYFQPKDIVSGDFYWFEKFGSLHMIAAADCTGHGVPGAFMSIIGCNLMSQAVNEYALTKPAVILNSLNKGLSKILHQRMEESVKDGMDIALCVVDPQRMTAEYAGAFNPMWIIRNGALLEFRGDKFPVGAFLGEQLKMFSNQEVQLQKGDAIYLFSDGYANQFGGPKGKKFKYKQLKELLVSVQDKPMAEQKNILKTRLESWKGNLEQVDDILVIGVRV
jgi:serine phosphatase RsbU (regulator of sigma subunit)/Tfp pilus assembly protein PilF